jgi:hypothetical protein
MKAELQNYINLVNQEWENDELFELAILGSNRHGIDNLVIWIGTSKTPPDLRIIISNIPNRIDMYNSFVIMMPSLDYDLEQVAEWITSDIFNKIKQWIVLNQELLYDYETWMSCDTGYLLDRISAV